MIARLLVLWLSACTLLSGRETLLRHTVDGATDTHVEISIPFNQVNGGFVPLRVKIANNRPDPLRIGLKLVGNHSTFGYSDRMEIQGGCGFRFEASGGGVVSRDLLAPLSGEWGQASWVDMDLKGTLEVEGQTIPFVVPVPNKTGGSSPGGSVVLCSTEAGKIENGRGVRLFEAISSGLPTTGTSSGSTTNQLRLSEFDPADLPEDWLAYSGFDSLLLTDRDWTAASPGARRAVMSWVRSGGRLVVLQQGKQETTVTGFTKEEWADRKEIESTNESTLIPAGFGSGLVVTPRRSDMSVMEVADDSELMDAGMPQAHPWLEITDLGREQVELILKEKAGQPPMDRAPAKLRAILVSMGYGEKQARVLVREINRHLDGGFNRRRNPPKAVMAALNRFRPFLFLPSAKTVSVEAASMLSSGPGIRSLHLSGLESLPPELASALVRGRQRKNLFLTGLSSLSPDAARAIASEWAPVLSLCGLRELGPGVAQILAGGKTQSLILPGLRTISSQDLAALQNGTAETIDLSGLEALPDDRLPDETKFRFSETIQRRAPGRFDFVDLRKHLVSPDPGSLTGVTRGDFAASSKLPVLLGEKDFGTLFFLIALGLFGVLVAPVNLWVFARAGKRHRLFVTTPLIAIAFSLLLGVVVLMMDGTGGTGVRQAVVEIVEDGATSTGHVVQEQYSRCGPLFGSGFTVDPACQVLPARVRSNRWTRFDDRNSGNFRFDLQPEGGVLKASGDWFQSRSEQGMVLRAVVPMRGGVMRSGEGHASGFGFPVDEIYLRDGSGEWHRAEGVAPGAVFTAKKLERQDAIDSIREATSGFGRAFGEEFFDKMADRKNCFIAVTRSAPGIDTHRSVRWSSTRTILTGRIR